MNNRKQRLSFPMKDIPIGQAIRIFVPIIIGIIGYIFLGIHTVGELYSHFILGDHIRWMDYWLINILVIIFVFIGSK